MTTNAQQNGAPAVMRPTNTRFLNSSPAAEDFMMRAAISSGARSMLADPDKLEDSDSSAAALNSLTTLREGVATIEALNKDESRTLPQRNHVALKVAEDTAAKIEHDGAKIERRAASLWEAGTSEAASAFAPDLARQAYDAAIMTFIREQAAKEEGVTKLHDLVRQNVRVAGVLFYAEPFLLGLNEKVHSNMRFDAIKAHAPKAWEKMERSAALQDVPAKFRATAANVRRYFADKLQAAKMNSRVGGFD